METKVKSQTDDWDKYQNKRIYRPRSKRIGIWRSLGWGISDTAGASTISIVAAWGLFFWTTYCGLSATEAASILAIARVVDAINSLIIGNVSDKLYVTRIGRLLGRRHIFLLFGAPFLLESLLYWIPGHSYWYYLLTYLGIELITASIAIPAGALPIEMTKNFTDRAKMSTTEMTFTALFGTLATFIQGQLFRIFPKSSPTSFLINAAIFASIAVCCILITYSSTWEHFVTKTEHEARLKENEKKSNLQNQNGLAAVSSRALKDYFSTFRNRSFRQYIGIYLFSYTSMVIWTTVIVYYIVDVLGRSGTLAANIQSLSIIGLPITILSGFLMVKFSPRTLGITADIIVIVSSLFFWILWKMNVSSSTRVALIVAVSCVFMVGRYIIFFLPKAISSYVIDMDQLMTAESRAGVYNSISVFADKLSLSLATFLIGFVLDENGFLKGKIQQPMQAQTAIVGLISIGVIVFALLTLWITLNFHINKDTHREIMQEVSRLRMGGNPDDATDRIRKLTKQLTGISYDECSEVWKNYQAEQRLNEKQ